MKRYLILIFAAAFVPAAFAANCEGLASLKLPNTTITVAKSVPAGAFTPAEGGRAVANLPAFCEVHGLIKPTPVSAINFEVWLPDANWNGRFEGVGNGGLAGTISYAAMGTALRAGFATASTDTGHTNKEPAEWLQNRERVIDYSYRGLHLTALDAKAAIDAYYSKAAQYSYYTGCSTGGKQGLMEAQRFPDDFDGIVAGDAANWWTHQEMSEVWDGVATGTPETRLSTENLALLQKASLAQCDALDGAKDGLVSDPAHCHFDPRKLQCKGANTANCLTAAQVGAVQKLYSGPVNPRTHKKLYAGLYPGGEVGWGRNGGTVINKTTKSGVSSYTFFGYALFKNPDWNFHSFDFDHDAQTVDETLGPIMNAVNPDLSEFRRLNHKMIYYHGVSDPLIPAQNGIDYYNSVVKTEGDMATTQKFFRAFLVPGLYHCAGGPGPTAFGTSQPPPESQADADHDIVKSIERWVEQSRAPDKIVATAYVEGRPANGVAFQRPLCAYPMVARYKGSGDMKDASNFTCVK